MREERRWQWYWMPTAVLLIGMFSITLLVWVNQISERQRINSLFIDAIMDVQINTATAHLWLEEALGGDATINVKETLAQMDQAISLANSILKGGPSEHGLIPEPLKDPDLRARTEALRSMIMKFKTLALERLREPDKKGIGSVTDQLFDALFNEILGKSAALEDAIDKTMASDRAKSDRLFLYILVAWIFIITVASVGLWNRERRRKAAEEALLKANEQLLSQAEELTKHRVHLAELVETRTAELTTANERLQVEIGERRRMEGEVRKLNEELEAKIAERTKQLLDTQEELVHSEKLAMLGQIAGNMGNELRNPLGVMNNAVFFLQTVMPDADETIREYLEIIGKEIDISQQIISDLTDFCRGRSPRTEPVALRELIHQSREKCTIPENIRFQADLPESLPKVQVDPVQMGQVFRNLIDNAVQAMPKGGALHISAQQVRGTRNEERGNEDINLEPQISNLDPSEDFIEISITDAGEGIAPGNIEKLFQPLFTTKSRGIGLGLAISRKFIEANGGRIEVESRPGDGATFTVTLPVTGE